MKQLLPMKYSSNNNILCIHNISAHCKVKLPFLLESTNYFLKQIYLIYILRNKTFFTLYMSPCLWGRRQTERLSDTLLFVNAHLGAGGHQQAIQRGP